MVITIEMPKLSDTMSEGKILQWHKAEGDKVRAGEVIAEIESDKANMEMEVPDAGYLRKIIVPAGSAAPVGTVIAVMSESLTEDISSSLAKAPAAAKKPAADHGPTPPAQPAPKSATVASPPAAKPAPGKAAAGGSAPPAQPTPAAASSEARQAASSQRSQRGEGRILASPLAFRMASELGLELSAIRGTGPEGRIVKRDIVEAASKPAAPAATTTAAKSAQTAARQSGAPYRPPVLPQLPAQSHDEVQVSSMRRIISTRLVESKAAAPHFYLTVEVDMKLAIKARDELNSITGVEVTFNDLVVKAVALALGRHPGLNSSWQGDTIRHYHSVDIGVAVALPDGLITPVVRGAHLKSLGRISQDIKDLVERAKNKKLTPDDYKGGTFTISNLGMFGVKHFTAIINPPEACILAVSAIQDVPVVEDGAVVPGKRMSLTLSSDHRVVDGASAAAFMRDLKQLLETPVSLAL